MSVWQGRYALTPLVRFDSSFRGSSYSLAASFTQSGLVPRGSSPLSHPRNNIQAPLGPTVPMTALDPIHFVSERKCAFPLPGR